MPAGKLAAQAGHAFDDTLHLAHEINPELRSRYRTRDLGGSKVVLKSRNLNQLITAYNQIKSLNIPVSLVVDQDHVMPPHFDGSPIITALGIGPCTKDEIKHITKKFNCV